MIALWCRLFHGDVTFPGKVKLLYRGKMRGRAYCEKCKKWRWLSRKDDRYIDLLASSGIDLGTRS